MFEDDEDDEVDFNDVLHRFENQLKHNGSVFIEEEEFVNIIAYYIDVYEFKKAKAALDIALNVYPNSFDLQIREVDYLISTNMVDQAHAKLDQLEVLYPENYEILFHRAQCHYIMGKNEIAKNELHQSLKCCSYNIVEHTLRVAKLLISFDEFTDAIKYLQKLLSLNPDDKEIIWEIAMSYAYANNNKSSIEYLQKYIDIDPLDEKAWIQIGLSYRLDNQLDNALEAYDFALAINPTHNDALDLKTDLLMSLNRVQEVIEMYEYLIKTYPLNVMLLLNLGNIYYENKQSSDAERLFQKALGIEPDNAYANNVIGNYYLDEDKVLKAIPYLKKATKLVSSFVFWMDLGFAYNLIDDEFSALEAYKKAIEIYPDLPNGYVMVANTLINANDNEGALLMIDKLENKFPDSVQVFIIKALALYNLSRIRELIETLRFIKELDTENIDIFENLLIPEDSLEEIKRMISQIP